MQSASHLEAGKNKSTLLKAILAGVVYGLAGFALNWFKLELFFNVDFLFGSVITMFALMRFGPVTGVTAALIAASCTIHHWHHPWAILIFAAEALCTALFYRRRNWDAVVNNLAFWCSAGLLLVLFFYQVVMGFPFESALVMALKQGINGITNTLLASACYLVYCFKSRQQAKLPSFRQLIFQTISLSVIVPAFIFLYFDLRHSLEKDLTERQLDTFQTALAAQTGVSLWLRQGHLVIQYLAATGTDSASPLNQKNLDALHSIMPTFRRIGVVNAQAVTTLFSPARDEAGASTIGLDLSQRPYLAAVETAPYPTVTQLFRGKIGVPGPRLILVAPILAAGRYQGAVFGVAELGSLKQLLIKLVQEQDTNVTLVDDKGEVVVTTRTGLRPLDRFTLPPNGTLAPISSGVNHWIPNPQPGIGPAKRWLSSFYLKELPVESHPGWKLVVEASLKPTLMAISRQISLTMAGIGVLLLLMVLFSRFCAKRIAAVVSDFERITRQVPEQIAAGANITWPAPSTVELQGLTDNVQQMSAAISRSHYELRLLNATLEQRVEERTGELRQQQQRLANIIIGTNIGTWEWNVQASELIVNERWADIIGYRLAELQPVTPKTWQDHVHPDDRKLALRLLSWHLEGELAEYMCECRMRHKDGSWVWVLAQGKVVSWATDGKPLLVSGTHQDITSRKRTEEALRESQELLQAIIETTPDPISVRDREGSTIMLNKAGQEFLGKNSEELLGKNASELFPHELAATLAEQNRTVLEEERIVNFEQSMRSTQGELRFFNVVKGPIRDSGGKVTGIFGIFRDITARIEAEELLEQERSLFRTIISTIPDLVFLKDPDGLFLTCNPAFEAVAGAREADIIGRSDFDLWPREMADAFQQQDQEIMRTGESVTNNVWVHRGLDGEESLLETRKTPVYDRAGKRLGILGISRDITAAYEAEQELQRRLALQARLEIIADTAPGALFEYISHSDGSCSFPYVSASVAEFWGFGPETVKTDGSPVWELVHPEDREQFRIKLSKPGKESEPVVTEFRLQSPKGELWMKAAAVPMKADRGEVTWFGFLNDVTHYKRAEQVLRESEGTLKKAVARRTEDLRRLAERIEKVAEQERASIAQEIHDELGQLLAALMIDVAWFQKRVPEGDQKFAQKLTAMNDLLGITIGCARRLTRDLRPRMLDELGLVAAIESQLEWYRERHIACCIRVPHRDIEVDQERSSSLFRIFQESMTNVMRHSGANRVDIVIDITQARIVLKVSDNGRGITPPEQKNLESLGLLGIRERVFRWDGEVAITGAPGKGTTVKVTLPMERRTR